MGNSTPVCEGEGQMKDREGGTGEGQAQVPTERIPTRNKPVHPDS